METFFYYFRAVFCFLTDVKCLGLKQKTALIFLTYLFFSSSTEQEQSYEWITHPHYKLLLMQTIILKLIIEIFKLP